MDIITGIDLSDILGGNQNIGEGQKVAIADEIIGSSQLLGAHAQAVSQVYAY